MSDLPTPWNGGPPTRQIVRAARAAEKTEDAIYGHFLAMEFSRQCEAIDASVLAEVIKDSLSRELETYDWAMERVGGSAAKAQLVADKISLLSKTNSTRIARGFGG